MMDVPAAALRSGGSPLDAPPHGVLRWASPRRHQFPSLCRPPLPLARGVSGMTTSVVFGPQQMPGRCQHPSMFFFFFLPFLGAHPWHMEVPRLGVQSEL